eukprot:537857_1
MICALLLLSVIYSNICNGSHCTCKVTTQTECEAAGKISYDELGNIQTQCTWDLSHHRCRNTVWYECMKDSKCIWIRKSADEDESNMLINQPCGIDQEDHEEAYKKGYRQQYADDQQPQGEDKQFHDILLDGEQSYNEQPADDRPNNDNAYYTDQEQASYNRQPDYAIPDQQMRYLNSEEEVNDEDMSFVEETAESFWDGMPDENSENMNDQYEGIVVGGNDESDEKDVNVAEKFSESPFAENSDMNVEVNENADIMSETEDENKSKVYKNVKKIDIQQEGIMLDDGDDGLDGINREQNMDVIVGSSMKRETDNIQIFATIIVIIIIFIAVIYYFIRKKKTEQKLLRETEIENESNYLVEINPFYNSYSTF